MQLFPILAICNILCIPLDALILYEIDSFKSSTAIFIISIFPHLFVALFIYCSLHRGFWETGNDAKTGNPLMWMIISFIFYFILVPVCLNDQYNFWTLVFFLSSITFYIVQGFILFYLYKYASVPYETIV